MEIYKVEDLSFQYPEREEKALDGINFSINSGEFVCVMGKSGCGKTTLLRLLKNALSPVGKQFGNIFFLGKCISEYDNEIQAQKIGFVMQNVEAQLVTDKVWHELAFGLESLGVKSEQIRARVAEMASFFGIGEWFLKDVKDLSGGQKQLLNLASVMVMQPSVLILDEPTSQLDPIAAMDFLKTLERINSELGTTIIISEHRTEEIFSLCDRVIVMESGKIVADEKVDKIFGKLKNISEKMCSFLPTGARIYQRLSKEDRYPITVRDAKVWLESFSENKKINLKMENKEPIFNEVSVKIKNAWFRYDKNEADVIRDLNLEIGKGEIFSVLGGNGSGKSTMLSLISRVNKLNRGRILINGENIFKIKNLYDGVLGVLPQNPQSLFVKKTVLSDLLEMTENEIKVKEIADLCQISHILNSHPFDISGGEAQRVALCKILLKNPEIILLDEPTKGFDAQFKVIFKRILEDLRKSGKTIIMVSHDIEFCAEVSDRCGMFFDGAIVSAENPREFFGNNYFYTTAANRISKNILPMAITAEDVINAFSS